MSEINWKKYCDFVKGKQSPLSFLRSPVMCNTGSSFELDAFVVVVVGQC